MKKKVGIYIDGFNVYHSILYLEDRRLKWINYRKLFNFFLNHSEEVIEKISLFTARPLHLKSDTKNKRHDLFSTIQEKYCNIKVIQGKFLKKDNGHHEEKQTDVSLAISIISDVLLHEVDTVFIVSRDTDFIPVINKLKELKELNKHNVNIKVIEPPNKFKKSHNDIVKALKEYYRIDDGNKYIKKITETNLKQSLLPDKIEIGGKTFFNPYKDKI